MKPRIENPAMLLPEAVQALFALNKALNNGSVPASTTALMHLRASQINGCSVCVDMHARDLRKLKESDERMFTVAAWRDAPYFTEAERAALALAECVTRMSDRSDPVPDDVWAEAARYYDGRALTTLVSQIALVNVWNRLNVATKQIAGEWAKSKEARELVAEAAR